MNLGELRQRVDRTSNLPSLPTVVTKIIAAVDDPRACVSRLNELIGQEPALATRMLRLANSAYFGRRNSIVSLSQCAVVLGFNTIRSLALSASVQRLVQQSGGGRARAEAGNLLADPVELQQAQGMRVHAHRTSRCHIGVVSRSSCRIRR